LRITNYELSRANWKWLSILVIGIMLGFLTKVSFALLPAALVLDFVLEKRILSDRRKLLKYLGFSALAALGFAAILLLSKYIFPFFNLQSSLKYWRHFANFGDRGWLQTTIQFAKAILYTSPLLILPALFVDNEIWKKTRPFLFFIFVGLFFYLIAFDFSTGALDRYFQFLVIPLSIISGAVLAKALSSEADRVCKPDIAAVLLISLGIFALQFFDQFVPPLYPKTEWLSRLVSFKWNFLFPFTGGSGPLPFYVSFQFIALLWIVSAVFALLALINREVAKRSLFAILVLGLLYNSVFAEEYLFGKINGNAADLVRSSVEFIQNNPEIKKVVVYNDNGSYEVQQLSKYFRRLYATPQFEATYRDFFRTFSGHVLYVGIPVIGENTFYSDYLASCKEIYMKEDKYITSRVLECLSTTR
jgi:hypothetical protein